MVNSLSKKWILKLFALVVAEPLKLFRNLQGMELGLIDTVSRIKRLVWVKGGEKHQTFLELFKSFESINLKLTDIVRRISRLVRVKGRKKQQIFLKLLMGLQQLLSPSLNRLPWYMH